MKANGWAHSVFMEGIWNNHSELQLYLFITNNLPNTAQQGEKKHNCYLLYNFFPLYNQYIQRDIVQFSDFVMWCILSEAAQKSKDLTLTAFSAMDLLWDLEQVTWPPWASEKVSLDNQEWPFTSWSVILLFIWQDCYQLMVTWGDVLGRYRYREYVSPQDLSLVSKAPC